MTISDDLVIVNVTDKIVNCIRLVLVLLAAVKLQIPELKPLDKIKLRTSKIKEFSKTPDYLPRNNGIYRCSWVGSFAGFRSDKSTNCWETRCKLLTLTALPSDTRTAHILLNKARESKVQVLLQVPVSYSVSINTVERVCSVQCILMCPRISVQDIIAKIEYCLILSSLNLWLCPSDVTFWTSSG